MAISENERLDLRQVLERVLDERLAGIAMEAMPPVEYDQFATKTDLEHLEVRLASRFEGLESEVRAEIAELRGEMGGLRGDIGQLRGDLFSALNTQLRLLVGMQLATFLGLGTWITAVT